MRLELVAFDLYGTLLDVSGLAKRLEPYAGPQAADLLSGWRKAQLERTWRGKAYEPFDVVTARALEEVAPRLDAQTRQSEEHTSELQSLAYLVCRLLLEKKKIHYQTYVAPPRTG